MLQLPFFGKIILRKSKSGWVIDMFASERRSRILEIMQKDGRVQVDRLAEEIKQKK